MGYTNTRDIIRWWNPTTNKIGHDLSVIFDEENFVNTDTETPPGCLKKYIKESYPFLSSEGLKYESISTTDNPFISSDPKEYTITLPPKGIELGINISLCEYFNISYISGLESRSCFKKSLHIKHQKNTWILSIDNK